MEEAGTIEGVGTMKRARALKVAGTMNRLATRGKLTKFQGAT